MGHDPTFLAARDSERSWLKVLNLLDEAPARLMAAQRAQEQGRGGVTRVAKLTGFSRTTLTKGMAELLNPKALRRIEGGRSRRFGGGRRRCDVVDPGLIRALTIILEETTVGDPMSALKWTNKSTRTLADELTQQKHPVSRGTVARLLVDMEYTLQVNVKALEGEQHVDRDAQFQYINSMVKDFLTSGNPVTSVDTKKRELVGRFKNAGQSLRPRGKPQRVNTYDYRSQADGIAIPFGTYDVAKNQGLVNVGVSADTSEFAVESIRRWWKVLGKPTYPKASRLLVCADGGGSNGSRRRTWKWQLQQLATELQVPITVCHYPPGTSKWNKIEHRLFSQISLNWRGKALVDYETIINLIGNTKTRTGLQVKALLDKKEYQKGVEISNQQMESLALKAHETHPTWNYTISPATQP
jgi:hypothetical protein